jgi:hypothetical protein
MTIRSAAAEGRNAVLASRYFGKWPLWAIAAPALAAWAMPSSAAAQGHLEAQYIMTLAGLPIGKGTWLIDVSDSAYSSAASGATTGLLRAFTGGEGSTAARGSLQGGKPLLSTYTATIKSSRKTDEIRFVVNKGEVKDLKIDPPRDDDNERVPITEENQRGVLDPMTATLVRVPGAGNMLAPEACQRTLPVFDGRLRYDLQLAFKRVDKVKAEKGYEGPVVVCAVYFSPVAGHVPSRAAIKYIARLRDIEVWLAPIAGTRVLAPYRIEGPTPIGPAVLEATQFVSTATPAKEAAKSSDKASGKAAVPSAKTP